MLISIDGTRISKIGLNYSQHDLCNKNINPPADSGICSSEGLLLGQSIL